METLKRPQAGSGGDRARLHGLTCACLAARPAYCPSQLENLHDDKLQPRPRVPCDAPSCSLVSGTGLYLGLGFHNLRTLCAERTRFLARLSPKIKNSRVFTVSWDQAAASSSRPALASTASSPSSGTAPRGRPRVPTRPLVHRAADLAELDAW